MGKLSDHYSRSVFGAPVSDWENLEEHALNVAQKASDFANSFNSGNWAWNLGLLHDLGKSLQTFKAKILRQNGLLGKDYDSEDAFVHHSTAGAVFAERHFGLAGRILSYAIAGHHAGLTDYDSPNVGKGSLRYRLDNGKTEFETIDEEARDVLWRLREIGQTPVDEKGMHLWIRMLFSCLVDADHLCAEKFSDIKKSSLRTSYKPLSELKRMFDAHMDKLVLNCPKTPVNTVRNLVLQDSRNAARLKPGLFTMTVPTGGSKTLSATAFALDHAVMYEKVRIIYVIPYTSIIEQTSDILREIFGYDQVLEHHSNLNPDDETERMKLSSENWDAKFIVTTNVQFFESLYAAKPGRCRKLHNLVKSVIILDEAQLLPHKWILPCSDVINRLVSEYGASIVLSTATQPNPAGLMPAREIVSDKKLVHDTLKRTEIIFPADLQRPTQWPELAHQLRQHKQVLCVVSSRRDCYDLYKMMPSDTIHLSALMCGAHRTQIIGDLKNSLQKGENVRVISTQLIEAGVDIDFRDDVYRAMAGLDSILQTGGRCNREGRAEGLGKVHVFIPPSPPPYDFLRKAYDATIEIVSLGLDPYDPETCRRYFTLLYKKLNDLGKGWLYDMLQRFPEINFRTADQEFRLINDQDREPVIVLYGESSKWIQELKLIDKIKISGQMRGTKLYQQERNTTRRLQRYIVHLAAGTVEKLLADQRLIRLESGPVIQVDPDLYDLKTGLRIY